jgi:RND family efflux transporter MFP subunit
MKKAAIVVVVLAALAGIAFYSGVLTREGGAGTSDGAGATSAAGQGAGGGGGGQGGSSFAGGRAPLTVEVGRVSRQSVAQQITVVGNLIGDATVSVAPRAAGRLQEVSVRLGDRVARGQRIAKLEDFELLQQVKQAEAAQQVSVATIRQREAELKLAETNAERSRNLYERQLLPKQTLDDTESRYIAALAQLDLAKAQSAQTKARLDELVITLENTIITSPLNGLVAKRAVDPGAFVSQSVPVVDVVDIGRVRLVANVVEKDLKDLHAGNATRVEVDAYPGESFTGRIARVSPVLDPTTRTAPIEVEIPNADYRLKPGMYARVSITTGTRKDALVVPSNAVVDLGGRRGVFQPQNGQAIFRVVQVGLEQPDIVEILGGLAEHETVVTTGAGALRDGDRIVLAARDSAGDAGSTSTRRGGGSEDAARDAAAGRADGRTGATHQ